ncbi:MAG: SMI1/KNR4 family protein [Armatimonadota bacterium]|nr:SMI1/KNR4 family protein [Armatimonadota bacterium]
MTLQEEVMALLKSLLPPGESMPVGASESAIAGFEARTGLQIPSELHSWLKLCNTVGGCFNRNKSMQPRRDAGAITR